MRVKYETPCGGYVVGNAYVEDGKVAVDVLASEVVGIQRGNVIRYFGETEVETIDQLLDRPGWERT